MSLRAFGKLPSSMQNDTTRLILRQALPQTVPAGAGSGIDIALSLILIPALSPV